MNDIMFLSFGEVKKPEFTEKKIGDAKYVRFGEDNLYPDYLLERFNESPKHGAILKGKTNYIVGNGFANDDKINDSGETKNDLLKKVAFDLCLFGGFYIQVIEPIISGGTKQYYHIPFNCIRTNKDNNVFWFLPSWKEAREKDAKQYPAYGSNAPSSILMYKEYRPGLGVYPLPDYFSSLNPIAADCEVQKHIYNNSASGFTATKAIQFFNGEPTEEEKRKIEAGFKKKFSGATGEKFIIVYNKDAASKVSFEDLGTSDLSKENFEHINNLIQQEIYAGHGVTSPMLFGIKTEGQLGGRTELREAYEIFTNTYINNKQKQLESVFTGLFGEDKIAPCEPIGFELSEATLKEIAPKQWLLDKAGISAEDYPDASGATMPVQQETNEALRNLSGRQYQNIMRVVREYSKGKLSKSQAMTMLRNGYGLSDSDILTLLGEEQQNFSDQEELAVFSAFGEDADDYVVVKEKKIFFSSLEDMYKSELDFNSHEYGFMSALESSIVDLIRKDKRVTAEIIAKTLDISVTSAEAYLKSLKESGIITEKSERIGSDTQITRKAKPNDELPDFQKPLTTQIYIRYRYTGPNDSKTRDFCKGLLSMNKIFSRSDIETMSQRLGYSVWERRGGWYTVPGTNEHRPYCRHSWVQQIVIKKK